MSTKRRVKRFDEGGDARAGMGFAGTGSGLAGSGASDASAGRGDSDGNGGESGVGRNTGDASRSGGAQEAAVARAGDSLAGTGSGLGGTGVQAARSGIGGDGPSLGERKGDYVSSVQSDKTIQKNNQVKSEATSLGLGINNENKKYQLSKMQDTGGDVTYDAFKNYTNPYSAQNEFNYELSKLKPRQETVYKKGGAINLKDCKVSTHKPSKKKSSW